MSFDLLNQNKKSLLVEIRYLYGLNENASSVLNQYFQDSDETTSLADLQKALIEFVINNESLAKCKPNWKYRRSFYKCTISIIEALNEEVNEILFDSYISLINDSSNKNLNDANKEKYFVTFFDKVNFGVV